MSEFLRNIRLWFAPERVRAEGGTPDYRFSLADERTFLAWLRTALALIGGGFAVDQFLPELRRVWRVGPALLSLLVVHQTGSVHMTAQMSSPRPPGRGGT